MKRWFIATSIVFVIGALIGLGLLIVVNHNLSQCSPEFNVPATGIPTFNPGYVREGFGGNPLAFWCAAQAAGWFYGFGWLSATVKYLIALTFVSGLMGTMIAVVLGAVDFVGDLGSALRAFAQGGPF